MQVEQIFSIDRLEEYIRRNETSAMRLDVKEIPVTAAHRIANALDVNTSLSTFSLMDKQIGDAAAVILAKGLRGHEGLQKLYLHNNQIGDEGIKAIAGVLPHMPNLQYLTCSDNLFGDEGAKALANSLKECRTLKSFKCYSSHLSEEGRVALREGLIKTRSKLLDEVVLTGTQFLHVSQMINQNRAARMRLRSVFRLPEKQWTSYDLREMADHLPNIRTEDKQVEQIFQKAVEGMPGMPQGGDKVPDSLFWPDASGFAPLDNPYLWANAGEAKQALERFDITPTHCSWQTERGGSLLEALAYRMNGDELLSHLNQRNIRLGANELLTPEGEPNTLFTILLDRHQSPAVFSFANWRGKPVAELQKVYDALPSYLQEEVGLSALKTRMRQAEPRSGLGR